MEILNNIWLALSTPNEGLTNILVAFMTLPESFFTMSLFLSIFNISSSKKQRILYTFSFAIFSVINMYVISAPYNVFINYIAMIILIHYIFKLSILKSISASVSSAILYSIVGFLLLNPFINIFNLTSEVLMLTPLYRLGFLLISYICVILLILLIRKRQYKISLIDNIAKKEKFPIYLNLLLGIMAIIIQTFITFYYLDTLPLTLTFLSFISLLAYFSISIYSLNKATKLSLTKQKLESAEYYNNTLRILHDNVRGFKHDFDNIVTTIGGYIKTDDMEGLKKYYSELEDDCERVNNLYVLNPEIVNNDGIYNLLTKKYNEADSKNIKVNISFLLDLGNLHMKIYEFAKILGILFDNAIEASSECEEKIINISFRNDTKNSRELIIIENTYNDKNVDTEKIYEKGVSGKDNHTGLGLWEVRKIIKKNNNINLHTSKTDKFFSQTLEIYY